MKLEILYLQFIFKLFIVNDQKADYNNEEYHITDVVLVQFYYWNIWNLAICYDF